MRISLQVTFLFCLACLKFVSFGVIGQYRAAKTKNLCQKCNTKPNKTFSHVLYCYQTIPFFIFSLRHLFFTAYSLRPSNCAIHKIFSVGKCFRRSMVSVWVQFDVFFFVIFIVLARFWQACFVRCNIFASSSKVFVL